MRRLAVFVIALALLAGCGGAQVTVEEVPGGPADLTVPGTGQGLAPAATPTPTPTGEATPTPTPASATTTPDDTSGDAGTTTPQGTDEGGTAAPDGEDSATNDQQPPAGSDADQFEDFCAQNPGAC